MIVKYFSQLKSTNLKGKELAKKGVRPWTVIVAEKQTSGHGKEGIYWHSPKGGLYFSIILPKSEIEDLQTLTILAAFVVAKTIKENYPLEVLIKLPNDVLIGKRKIAGILTENIIGKDVKLSVMGIGLNTNIARFPKNLEKKATSLRIELGERIDNKKILEKILKGIKEQLAIIGK